MQYTVTKVKRFIAYAQIQMKETAIRSQISKNKCKGMKSADCVVNYRKNWVQKRGPAPHIQTLLN
jgi:hypothetical protein